MSFLSKKLIRVIGEFYRLDSGEIIKNPSDHIYFSSNVRITRRGLKHILEERKTDRYSLGDIKIMFFRVKEVFASPDLWIKNTNEKYADSYISGKLYTEDKEALLIVHHCVDGVSVDIITMFYRSRRKFEKMLGKK